MAVTMPWAEEIVVGMSLGFPVLVFTLDSATTMACLMLAMLDGALVAQPVTEFAQAVNIARGRSANQNEVHRQAWQQSFLITTTDALTQLTRLAILGCGNKLKWCRAKTLC
jgi:hypothetical protein